MGVVCNYAHLFYATIPIAEIIIIIIIIIIPRAKLSPVKKHISIPFFPEGILFI